MTYTYIDGDNIGLRIEQSFLNNNESGLQSINNNVSRIVQSLSTYLIKEKQEIIFSGADGVICKGNKVEGNAIIGYIQSIEKSITFSIGFGNSLKDSYIALRYAKSVGKNIAVSLSNGIFNIE